MKKLALALIVAAFAVSPLAFANHGGEHKGEHKSHHKKASKKGVKKEHSTEKKTTESTETKTEGAAPATGENKPAEQPAAGH